jgi:hypothetical protein
MAPPATDRQRARRVARRGTAALLALVVLLGVSELADGPSPRPALAGPSAPIEVYRGLGTWIDIYDDSAWGDPAGTVAAMKAHGVRTLYLETSNFNRGKAFVFPDGVQAFVDAAHVNDVAIVAWYLPGFDDLARDLRRSMAAIRYRTPSGNGFDSFALDIESPQVADPAVRTRRLLDLSQRIRDAVGADYPLGAIIPSPLRVRKSSSYWPDFPYPQLAQLYDAFLPMTYFTGRVSGELGAHRYTTGNIRIIREETGVPTVPIHVIGGIAGGATRLETRGFVHAVREHGIIGASFYTFPTITEREWLELANVPANPVESPALPVGFDCTEGLGNIPGGDATHPKEVVYHTKGHAGSWRLVYQGFDLQKGEVTIYVNWHELAKAAPTEAGAWSATHGRLVPDEWLNDASPNYIAFVAKGADPNWTDWGVRAANLVPTPSATASPTASPT